MKASWFRWFDCSLPHVCKNIPSSTLPPYTLHSRFRFLFSFLENILTLWPNQRLRPWEPFSHCRPENFSRSLTMSARRPDIARTPRSSNLIFIQRSVEFSHLIGSAFSNISLNITGNPSFLIRCLTIMIGIYLDGGWWWRCMVEKLKFERRSEHEEFETFGIVLQRKLNSMGLMINLL